MEKWDSRIIEHTPEDGVGVTLQVKSLGGKNHQRALLPVKGYLHPR